MELHEGVSLAWEEALLCRPGGSAFGPFYVSCE